MYGLLLTIITRDKENMCIHTHTQRNIIQPLYGNTPISDTIDEPGGHYAKQNM